MRPATKPTTVSRPAAVLRCVLDEAPFVADGEAITDALGEPIAPVAAVPEPVPGVVAAPAAALGLVALAAAWKAWKLFVAVGLTANTIPCSQ